MKTIYIVTENGDSYHGECQLKDAYESKAEAEARLNWYKANQEPCDHCGHTFWYSITELPLWEKED